MGVIYNVIGLAVGLGVGIALSATKLRNALEKKSVQVLKEAEEKSEILKKEKILQAKEKFLQMKAEHEKQVQERNNKVMQAENKIKQKEQALNQKVEELQKKSTNFLLRRIISTNRPKGSKYANRKSRKRTGKV